MSSFGTSTIYPSNDNEPMYLEEECAPEERLGTTIFFVLRGIYGFSSVFLYIVNIVAMWKSSIGKPFFLFYFTCAVMSIIMFLESWAVKQFFYLGYFCDILYNIFSEYSYFFSATRSISAYCPIAILLYYFLISFHRMTVIIRPSTTNVWDRHAYKILILSLLLPLLFMWFIIPCKGRVHTDTPVAGLEIYYKKNIFFCFIKTYSFLVVIAVVCGILTLINTLIMLISVKSKPVALTDFGMIYFEIVKSSVTIIYAAAQALLHISRHHIHPDHQILYNLDLFRIAMTDILILPQAFSLIVFSRTVRTSARTMFTLRKKTAVGSVLFFDYWAFIEFLDTGHWCDVFYRLLSKPNWIATSSRVIFTYCPIAILEFYYIISLHRMMTVIFPTKVKNWDNHIFKIFIVCLITPMLFMWFIIPCKGFAINHPVGGLGLDYERHDSGIVCSWSPLLFSGIASLFFGTLTLTNTIATMVVLKTRTVTVNDFGMIYFEIWIAFVTFVYAATQIILLLLRGQHEYEQLEWSLEQTRYYVLDLFILPQAWTLLLFSKIVRQSVKRLFNPSTTVITQQSSFQRRSTGFHNKRKITPSR